jgi:hypothetical protein
MIKYREEQLKKDPNNLALRASLESFKSRVVGNKFRGKSTKLLIRQDNETETLDKRSLYKATYGKYKVGHYDKEKYKEQMNRYRRGIIKSRPNGRRWCKLSRYFNQYRIVDDPSGKYIEFKRSSYPRPAKKIYS